MVARACNPSYSGDWGRRELTEPRSQRLQWAEIVPLYSSLGSKSENLSQKKKRRKKIEIQNLITFLYANNEQSKVETKNSICNSIKDRKYYKQIWQVMQDLYSKNYKIVLREIKEEI